MVLPTESESKRAAKYQNYLKRKHFTIKDGLPHNGVWSIMEDSKENIWIGTRNTGLCMYNGEKFVSLTE